ncbi:hypothetical protein D9M68_932210 [compost metagenome]
MADDQAGVVVHQCVEHTVTLDIDGQMQAQAKFDDHAILLGRGDAKQLSARNIEWTRQGFRDGLRHDKARWSPHEEGAARGLTVQRKMRRNAAEAGERFLDIGEGARAVGAAPSHLLEGGPAGV